MASAPPLATRLMQQRQQQQQPQQPSRLEALMSIIDELLGKEQIDNTDTTNQEQPWESPAIQATPTPAPGSTSMPDPPGLDDPILTDPNDPLHQAAELRHRREIMLRHIGGQ